MILYALSISHICHAAAFELKCESSVIISGRMSLIAFGAFSLSAARTLGGSLAVIGSYLLPSITGPLATEIARGTGECVVAATVFGSVRLGLFICFVLGAVLGTGCGYWYGRLSSRHHSVDTMGSSGAVSKPSHIRGMHDPGLGGGLRGAASSELSQAEVVHVPGRGRVPTHIRRIKPARARLGERERSSIVGVRGCDSAPSASLQRSMDTIIGGILRRPSGCGVDSGAGEQAQASRKAVLGLNAYCSDSE